MDRIKQFNGVIAKIISQAGVEKDIGYIISANCDYSNKTFVIVYVDNDCNEIKLEAKIND